MRAWLFLLSIWILVCAGMPCTDHLNIVPAAELQQEATHTATGAAEHSHTTDACSPFCSCYCCAVTSVLPKAVNYFPKPVSLPAPVSRYLCPPPQEPADAFWQPPRFS